MRPNLLLQAVTAAALLATAALIAVQPSNPAEAQAQSAPSPPVCDRTPQIRDAIVSRIQGVSTCSEVTVEQLAGVQGLDVQDSGITRLRAGDFNGMTRADGLLLFGNGLTSLPPGIFRDLYSLAWLGLGSNQLASLEPGIFDGLTRLEHLNLSFNPIAELPEGIFDDLASLTTLGLYSTNLENLPPDSFRRLESLETLTMGGNPLTTLPKGIFDGLGALVSLELQNNEFESIPENAFQGLTKLSRLWLTGNRLRSLPRGLLQGLVNLEEFDASQRVDDDEVPSHLYFYLEYSTGSSSEARVTFPVGAPHDMSVGLSASDGSIQRDGREIVSVQIDKGATESEPFQVVADPGVDDVAVVLSPPEVSNAMCGSEGFQYACYSGFLLHDGMTVPDPHMWRRSALLWTLISNSEEIDYSDLADITKQDLAGVTEFDFGPFCAGASIAPGDFNDFVNLRRLVVSHCAWDYDRLDLSDDAFSGLHRLEELVLDYNGLRLQDFKALEGLPNLSHLSLVQSRPDTLENYAFRKLGDLEFLNLSGSYITGIGEDTFAGLDSLRELQLQWNSLTTLPAGAFKDLSSLETLILAGNEISELPPDVFGGLTNLRGLDVSWNDFVALPDGLLDGLTALEAFNIEAQGPLTTEGTAGDRDTATWTNINLPVRLVRTQGSAPVARVAFPIGAPWDIEVGLSAVGGTITKNGMPIDSITIPTGHTKSPIFDLEPEDESTRIVVELDPVTGPPREVAYSIPFDGDPYNLLNSGLDIIADQVAPITLPDTGGMSPTYRAIALLLLAGLVLVAAATVGLRAHITYPPPS